MTTTQAEPVDCATCSTTNQVPAVAQEVPRCTNCNSPLPWLATAQDDNYSEVVEQSPLPALVDIWAAWCEPCQIVNPLLEKLARGLAGQLKLVMINVDESPSVSQRFSAHTIPTLVLVHKGEVVARHIGAAAEETLRNWLSEALTGVN